MTQAIRSYISGKRDELVQALTDLVAIDSTVGQPEPGKPFGPGPAAALDAFLSLARQRGFTTAENHEGYVGTVDLTEGETALHILGHLDIVDPGEGWTVTEPFRAKEVDGLLYGRGTSDDKGPLLAALLAMEAVKALDLPLKKNVRLILGTDEETGMRDVDWYYARSPHAPYTLSPDADFPIINLEKGHYQPTFSASWPEETTLPRVTAFAGGPRVNMIPPKASATVVGLTPATVQTAIDELDLSPAISFTLKGNANGLDILCTGQAAHGSTPEEGHNAQTALVALLARLPLGSCISTQTIRTLAAFFPHGDHAGKALGLAQADELSGPLTLAFTRLDLDATGFTARFDSRTPLCATEETVKAVTEAAMARAGFAVEGKLDPPHHVPEDDPFIQTLAKCYTQYTGQPARCLAIGGGTYVHDIPGGVAFGANFPGFASNLHGPDERVSIDDLLTTAMIYAQVIADLCM